VYDRGGKALNKPTEQEDGNEIKDCKECTVTKKSESLVERFHGKIASKKESTHRNSVHMQGKFGTWHGYRLK
jgi:Zn-finger protein